MKRIWRRDALAALAAYLVVDLVAIGAIEVLSHVRADDHVSVGRGWLVLELWLVWRVARRRGRFAWGLLVVANAFTAGFLLVFSVVVSAVTVVLVVTTLTQLALLLSPAVRHHLDGAPTPWGGAWHRGERRQPLSP